MTATLTLNFTDGTSKEILIDRVIEIDTPGKQEISFRETPKGWVMAFTKSVKDGKMFAENTLKLTKN
jgi:hypothetical protein